MNYTHTDMALDLYILFKFKMDLVTVLIPDKILYHSVLNPAFDHISNLKSFTEQISPRSKTNINFHLNS